MTKDLTPNAFQPFAAEGDWKGVFTTPWYSMVQREDWYRVQATSGAPGACVLAVDSEDRALLVKVYRPALDRICLEAPRGRAEVGETAVAAARRELEEETGLRVGPSEMIDLGVVYPDSGIVGEAVHLFAVRLGQPFPDLEADTTEVLGSRMVPLSHLETMIDAGLVCDAMTIVALKRLKGGQRQAPSEARDIEVEIEILDANAEVEISIRTRRPEWSFHQYVRNRAGAGRSWRFKAKS